MPVISRACEAASAITLKLNKIYKFNMLPLNFLNTRTSNFASTATIGANETVESDKLALRRNENLIKD